MLWFWGWQGSYKIMNDYDFSVLNDKEFENLTIDLISRDRGKRFERFKAGRDGGIDGRYYGEDGKQEILQCKHYLKTGYSGLISSLKKKNNGKNEADKVKLLDPKKYIFVTSLPLSASNKKEIKEIFKPYIKKDSDIYGQEDLNDLLKDNSDIEENHYKLWISSTTVLQRIFNNAIKGRSEFLIEEIKEKIKYYVITENHNKAIKKLESSHTIIIAGEPGIGKTTLAEQIALNYIEKGFEFCVIAKDISEAEAIFERDKKQIFYFDDFLGSNYLNALEAHTDSHIMQFIARIKRDKDKRFILTSRTIIFNQSLLLSDKFRTKKLDSDEFIITVDELAEIDKAKILYNHIWHSNLDEEYIDELYKEKRYKQIINHKNFNPRLIEFITDRDRIKSNSAINYWEKILKNLANPSEVWANTFNKQSDEYIRNIVSLVVFNGNNIKENELKDAYTRLNNLLKLQNSSHNSKEFDSVIEEISKYFLKRILKNNRVEYSLFNPSIADFIIHKYKNNSILIQILNSLKTIESLKIIGDLHYNEFIEKEFYHKIIQSIEYNRSDNINYLVKLAQLFYEESEDSIDDNIYVDYLEKIIDIILSKEERISIKSIYDFIKLLDHLIYAKRLQITPKIVEKIIDTVDNMDNYDLLSEFREVMNFFESHKILLDDDKFKNTLTKLTRKIESYFLQDYDAPSFISDDTILKIKTLIYQDIKNQTETYIDDFFTEIYPTPENNEAILNIFNKNMIEKNIKKTIIENCKDRLVYELFEEDNEKSIIKTPVLEKKAEVSSDSKVDEIDDLFQRD
jgi:nucleoside-triphosphatase THEP1